MSAFTAPVRATFRRTFARNMRTYLSEAHPHGRYPASLPEHPHAASFYANKLARTMVWYVPVAATLLGWPFVASAVLKRTGI